MTRVYGLGKSQNHSYPAYAPRVLWHRLSHWVAGPLRGCSCSGPGRDVDGRPLGRPSLLAAKDGSCFYSPWRLEYPARSAYADRVRIARIEQVIRDQGLEVPPDGR